MNCISRIKKLKKLHKKVKLPQLFDYPEHFNFANNLVIFIRIFDLVKKMVNANFSEILLK